MVPMMFVVYWLDGYCSLRRISKGLIPSEIKEVNQPYLRNQFYFSVFFFLVISSNSFGSLDIYLWFLGLSVSFVWLKRCFQEVSLFPFFPF